MCFRSQTIWQTVYSFETEHEEVSSIRCGCGHRLVRRAVGFRRPAVRVRNGRILCPGLSHDPVQHGAELPHGAPDGRQRMSPGLLHSCRASGLGHCGRAGPRKADSAGSINHASNGSRRVASGLRRPSDLDCPNQLSSALHSEPGLQNLNHSRRAFARCGLLPGHVFNRIFHV